MAPVQKAGRARGKPQGSRIAMPAVAGYHWGFYSREEPRMHLQVIDRQHAKLGYKVWLERDGKRVFEPAGPIPARILKSLKAAVEKGPASVEAEWVHLMIDLHWLTVAVNAPFVTLTAYPRTPNQFARTVDLSPYLSPETAVQLERKDVGLNSEFAVIEIWPWKPESQRPFIPIAPILWQD